VHLELESTDFLNFRDAGIVGPWIDVLRFRVRGEGDDADLLAGLISSRWYDHSYAEPRREHPGPRGGIHGPYRLDVIVPDTFTRSSPENARTRVREWAHQWDTLPAAFETRLELFVGSIHGNSSVYELPDLRATAEHDWGAVVGEDGFHEFAVIDSTRETVTLLVATDD